MLLCGGSAWPGREPAAHIQPLRCIVRCLTMGNAIMAVDDPRAELTSTEWRDLRRLAGLHGARPRGILHAGRG